MIVFFAAATATSPHLPANWPGWAVIIVVALLVLSWLLRLLGVGK